MQPTELQVQRALEALRMLGEQRRDRLNGELDECRIADIPSEVFIRLRQQPGLRRDRLEAARRRLECGESPTAEDLAERMIGRLVCDRLR